ncbi:MULTISPECIES: hypothetical protein [Bacillus]|uniref:hypothetical protein n=1 Tax=Bacillus TaxID=1386 RepID=UPI00273DC0AA|nr:hypothetical protein [Bacillus sp. MMSF_3328]
MTAQSQPEAKEAQVVFLGKDPLNPSENLIKVCVADSIGFAKDEAEAIQLIDVLQNW